MVSKFVNVSIKHQSDNPDNIIPNPYMISDQGLAIVRDQILQEPKLHDKKLMLRQPKDKNDIIPKFISSNHLLDEIEPEFFIITLPYGKPKQGKYNIFKIYDFPSFNDYINSDQEVDYFQHLFNYFQKNQNLDGKDRYTDFKFLLYIAKFVDYHLAS